MRAERAATREDLLHPANKTRWLTVDHGAGVWWLLPVTQWMTVWRSIATNIGVDAAQLTLGRTFHLAIPSWEDIMVINGSLWPDTSTAAARALFRLFRYMGVVIHQPMPIAASANYFSAGAVAARIIKDP